MKKGPDEVWRPLSDTEAPAQSPAILKRKKVLAEDTSNEIVDPNLNPEEHLLEEEQTKAEQVKEEKHLTQDELIEDDPHSPEQRWKRAAEK